MKKFIYLLTLLVLVSCNKANNSSKKQQVIEVDNKPCIVADNIKSVKFIGHNKKIAYYTILYRGGENRYDYLKLIVSDRKLFKFVKLDKKLDVVHEHPDRLLTCLRSKQIQVQDLWSNMKKSLDPIDEVNQEKKAGENGYYPKESIVILYPNADTFKINVDMAEIKSYIFSPVADTVVTTIKWKFKNGKYIFDKYTTTTIDDYDPKVD